MAATTPQQADRFIVVGANHQSSSLALRDRLFVEDAEIPRFLSDVRAQGIEQAVVASTCDRVDVFAVVPAAAGDDDTAARLVDVLARRAGSEPLTLTAELYQRADSDAVRHVFAVAASLDSQVIGEPQVLGQIKACHRLARDAGMVGGEMETLLQAAYAVAKRVRGETAIGERPVSMAAAAAQVARDLHGDLATVGGVLIGTAAMGTAVAEALRAAGLGTLTVMHPREHRANAAAAHLDCHVAPFEQLAGKLSEADIVICALGTRRRVLDADMVRAALRRRRNRPMFLVDAGIPGDIEPAVDRLEEAFLYDMNDLEGVALEGRASRDAEAELAWHILDHEVAGFLRDRAERTAVPVLTLLREHVEAARRQVLAMAPDDAERATRLLANRLLHAPSEALRDLAAKNAETAPGSWDEAERMLRRLFGLGAAETPEAPDAVPRRRREDR